MVSDKIIHKAFRIHQILKKKKNTSINKTHFTTYQSYTFVLKGKFSSGIEGALASTLNHDFNWKQLSEMIFFFFYFSLDVFKVYLSNIDPETAEI